MKITVEKYTKKDVCVAFHPECAAEYHQIDALEKALGEHGAKIHRFNPDWNSMGKPCSLSIFAKLAE